MLVGIFGLLMMAGGCSPDVRRAVVQDSHAGHLRGLALRAAGPLRGADLLFCVEHVIANLQRKEVVPAWL